MTASLTTAESHRWLKMFTIASISVGSLFVPFGGLFTVLSLARATGASGDAASTALLLPFGLGSLALGVGAIAAGIHALRVTDHFRHWNSGISQRDKNISYLAIFGGPVGYVLLFGLCLAAVLRPSSENADNGAVALCLCSFLPLLIVGVLVNSLGTKRVPAPSPAPAITAEPKRISSEKPLAAAEEAARKAEAAQLKAVRKYLRYLAINWWASQPESRKEATCDACGGRGISRDDGYLIGSSLWCEDCYHEQGVEDQIRRNPNSLGYGVFQKALDMFGKEQDA